MPNTQDTRRIQVLLADDHPLYSKTLALMLGTDDRIEVVGQAADGIEAVELALQLRPQVIVMDVYMPRVDGIEATNRLRTELPDVRVVMLSSSDAQEDVERARDAGAVAYLTKDGDASTIAEDVVCIAASSSPLMASRAA